MSFDVSRRFRDREKTDEGILLLVKSFGVSVHFLIMSLNFYN